MLGKKEKATVVKQDVNEHILNIITPSGIDCDSNHANIGDNVGKIFQNIPQRGWDTAGFRPCAT